MKSSKVEEPVFYYGLIQKYESGFSSPVSMALFANKGLPARSFDDLIRVSHQPRECFAGRLHLSLKSIERYKKENRSFDPIMSELILKWMQLYKKGIEVFGNVPAFNAWLEKPSFGLESVVPQLLLSTSSGVSTVLEELCRIEFGDLS